MKWISVNERLPEDEQTVIVTQFDSQEKNYDKDDYKNRIWIASFQKESGKFWASGGPLAIVQIWCVKHWMPLPEPPK